MLHPYFMNNMSTTGTSTTPSIQIYGLGTYDSPVISAEVKVDKGISPIMYFKYVKSKFKPLEKLKLDSRLKKIEKAFNVAIENGQEALAEKFLEKIGVEARESTLYVKGIRLFIEYDDLHKYKRKIRGGHISDTNFSEYTRAIPPKVLKRKKELNGIFDEFIIYHYWNPEAEDVKKMSPDEKAKMRDPVLFGAIKETKRLYFIADWEDEFCDLTFDELVDVLGKDEKDIALTRIPSSLV